MKNLTFLLLILFAFTGKSQDISGVWADSSSASFTNCYAIFSVEGDSIQMTHYLEFNGAPFVEYGKGIIQNNQVNYHVVVTKQIPGWTSQSGDHSLTLSNDSTTLRGTYTDNLGNTGPLVFKRKFPAKK